MAQLQFSNYAGPIMLGPPKVPGDCQFAVGCIFPGGSSVTAPALKSRQILHSTPEAVGCPLMWRGIVRNCPYIPPKPGNPSGREPVPGSVPGVLRPPTSDLPRPRGHPLSRSHKGFPRKLRCASSLLWLLGELDPCCHSLLSHQTQAGHTTLPVTHILSVTTGRL